MRFLWSTELSHRSSEFAANSNDYTHKHWEKSFQDFPLDTPETVRSHTNLPQPTLTAKGRVIQADVLCELCWPRFSHHWSQNLTEMWQTPPNPRRGWATLLKVTRSWEEAFHRIPLQQHSSCASQDHCSSVDSQGRTELILSTPTYSCFFTDST